MATMTACFCMARCVYMCMYVCVCVYVQGLCTLLASASHMRRSKMKTEWDDRGWLHECTYQTLFYIYIYIYIYVHISKYNYLVLHTCDIRSRKCLSETTKRHIHIHIHIHIHVVSGPENACKRPQRAAPALVGVILRAVVGVAELAQSEPSGRYVSCMCACMRVCTCMFLSATFTC
jgi:hypothetical protein